MEPYRPLRWYEKRDFDGKYVLDPEKISSATFLTVGAIVLLAVSLVFIHFIIKWW